MNEKIYYTWDTNIRPSLKTGRFPSVISSILWNKKKSYRRNGKKNLASLLALSWNDEFYYMIAYYEELRGHIPFQGDKDGEHRNTAAAPCAGRAA